MPPTRPITGIGPLAHGPAGRRGVWKPWRRGLCREEWAMTGRSVDGPQFVKGRRGEPVIGSSDAVEKGGSARKGDVHASARSVGRSRVNQGRLLVGSTGRELELASRSPDRRSPWREVEDGTRRGDRPIARCRDAGGPRTNPFVYTQRSARLQPDLLQERCFREASANLLDVKPVRAGGYVDTERNSKLKRRDHRLADKRGETGDFLVGGLEDQLIVDLQE
jgi:hypothetical protein